LKRKLVIRTATVMAVALLAAPVGGSCKQKLVETSYEVKDGDTLRSISEMYMAKNTGGLRYILEFESGIKELNPWLLSRSVESKVLAGDELSINYFVEDGDDV